MKKCKGNWRLYWLISFIVFYITNLIFDYCFDQLNLNAHHLIQRAVGSFVSGFIFAMLLSSVNPFNKRQKEKPESQKAG